MIACLVAMKSHDRARFSESILYPTLLVLIMWLIKGFEAISGEHLGQFGIFPLQAKGLIGIITAPFIHGSTAHLFANSIPLWVLGSLLFYVYRPVAVRVFILVWIITGIWVWFWGREAYHIGASGVVYGLASFLFFSGIFRRDGRTLAITFLVAFLYGSMVWGIFPELFPEKNISWESHLMGLIAGVVLAVFYKNQGPKPVTYKWEDDPELEEIDENDPEAYWNKPIRKAPKPPAEPLQINYVYKEKSKEGEENQ